jgi:poly(A) polymerase
MLRAIRFLGKLDINMSPETEAALVELRHLVKQVSPSRLFQETLKLFQEGRTAESFKQLQKYEMFSILFPPLYTHLNEDQTNSLLN